MYQNITAVTQNPHKPVNYAKNQIISIFLGKINATPNAISIDKSEKLSTNAKDYANF